MLLFVVVIALASATLVGGLEGRSKAADRWDAAFREANGAHVTIDGRDPATLAEVASLPEVAAGTQSYRRSADDLEVLRDGDALTTAFVREMGVNDVPDIAMPLLRDGRWASSESDDEIVVDRAFGLDEGIDVGDRIAIGTPAGPLPFTVVGRAIDLIDCFYPNCDPVTVWVAPAGFERLGVEVSSTVFLRLREPDTVDQFIAGLSDYDIGTQGWIDTRDDTLSVYEIFGAFLGAFGVFVMVAAAVVVAGSMATRAVARRRDIGLLNAVGTTPWQVAASIVLSHMLAAAVGVVAGWVLGGFLAPATEVDLGKTLGTGGVSPIRVTIVGWYRESEDTGEILRFSLADLQRVRPDAQPDWASINLAAGVSPEATAATLSDQLGGLGRVELQTTEGSAEIDAFRLAFQLVSLLVIIVAVANLASTMLLSVRERTHDLGVLRAVGVTPRRVGAMIAEGAAALAVVAAVIGVPLGLIVSNAVAAVVGSASGIGPGLGAGPSVAATVVLVLTTIALSAILGAVAARRAAVAEVSELVRYE
jgi:ABC-type lipoprotein release transport system permease subunit